MFDKGEKKDELVKRVMNCTQEWETHKQDEATNTFHSALEHELRTMTSHEREPRKLRYHRRGGGHLPPSYAPAFPHQHARVE